MFLASNFSTILLIYSKRSRALSVISEAIDILIIQKRKAYSILEENILKHNK